MFKRPLRIKLQNSVKKSERRQMLESISRVFPSLTSEILRSDYFPDGEDILCLKGEIVLAANPSGPAKGSPSSFTIYCNSKKQPYFVSYDIPSSSSKSTFTSIILPTVYALWLHPNIIPLMLSTPDEVLGKLQNGAKLMLAGANFSPDSLEFISTNEFGKDSVFASVSPIGKSLPFGVGRVLMDNKELRTKLSPEGQMKSELLDIVHFIGDELWALGDKRPPIEPPADVEEKLSEISHLEIDSESDKSFPVDQSDNSTFVEQGSSTSEIKTVAVEEMPDEYFRKVFLLTLKTKVSVPGELPLLASSLNKYMLELSRRVSSEPLDVKKTSYKKLGSFLAEMQNAGVIKLVKIKEGVEAVSEVLWKNDAFTGIEALPEEEVHNAQTALKIPASIRQIYIVNGKTAPVFQSVNPQMKKGYEFRSTDSVREVVTQYIKTHDLSSKTDKAVINLDKTLIDMLMNKTMKFEGNWTMKWGEVFDRILKEMSTNHEIVFTNGSYAELRGKFIPINVKVEKKAGNKLVTVIRHLEELGMDVQMLSRELQQIVGATVGIREEGGPNSLTRCITVQGDQTKLLDKFFFQTNGMSKKFVTGLEKPGKKG